MEEKDVSAILRIEGGTADDGRLDIHDAANTMLGLARSLNLVTHAFSNNEDVRTKGHSANGAKVFIHSSKKGCFEEQIDIAFEPQTVVKVGHSVITNNFWDYMTWCWSAAIGNDYEPTTPFVKKIKQKNEFFIYDIANILESPMQNLHKAVLRDKTVKIFWNRPRFGDILTFNVDSLDYVTTRDEKDKRENIQGNVTKFNLLSNFGRFYSDLDQRVVSFQLVSDSNQRVKDLVVGSMKDMVNDKECKLIFYASPVVNARGLVKKYLVHDIYKAV